MFLQKRLQMFLQQSQNKHQLLILNQIQSCVSRLYIESNCYEYYSCLVGFVITCIQLTVTPPARLRKSKSPDAIVIEEDEVEVLAVSHPGKFVFVFWPRWFKLRKISTKELMTNK